MGRKGVKEIPYFGGKGVETGKTGGWTGKEKHRDGEGRQT